MNNLKLINIIQIFLLNCKDSYSATNRSYIARCVTKDPNYYEKEKERCKQYKTKKRQSNIEDSSETEHVATGEFDELNES